MDQTISAPAKLRIDTRVNTLPSVSEVPLEGLDGWARAVIVTRKVKNNGANNGAGKGGEESRYFR